MRQPHLIRTGGRFFMLSAVSLAVLAGCGDSSYESDTGLALSGSSAPPPSTAGGGSGPGFSGGANGVSGTDDQVVATASTLSATAVVGGAETVTVTFTSSDGLPMSGFGVSGTLASLPTGWIAPKTFTCAAVSTGSGCVITLTYAPAAIDSGSLTLAYVVVDNAQTPRTTGTITIAYSATAYGNVMAVVSPTGQVDAPTGGSQSINVAFVTDDGNAATGFALTTDLTALPSGWTSRASSLTCPIVGTGSGCALLLQYAPMAAAGGTLNLGYRYTDPKGAAKTGTLGIPYFTTGANDVVATATPGGQIIAVQKTGGQSVPVTFTTDDGRAASQLYVTTNLAALPAGWTSAAGHFTCSSVSTGSGCQLALTYAPSALATGTLSLNYAYTDGAGAARTGLLNLAYAATTNDNIVATPSPTGQINAVVGLGAQPLQLTFGTDDAQAATALALTTDLSTGLPPGWSSSLASFACPGVNVDTVCQLPLTYAPSTAGSGTLALGYSYRNDAGQAKTGTVNVAYRATTDDNVAGTAAPTGFSVRSGSTNPLLVSFVTDDGNPASALSVTGGLTTLPPGWSAPAGGFACSTVSAGSSCTLPLVYAPPPASSASGTLSLQFAYTNDAGFAKTGTVAIPYAALTPYLYVANGAATNFSSCPLNVDDSIGACSATAFGLSAPAGLAFNGSSAYVSNSTANSVARCNIDGGGIITSCAASGGAFANPSHLAVDPSGTHLYVEQSTGVSVCTIAANDGSLGACAATAVAFQPLHGIAIAADGAHVYSVNGSSVVVCSVAANGALSACTAAGTPATQAVAALTAHRGNLYVATAAGLAVCPIKSDATLGSCQTMSSVGAVSLAFLDSTAYVSGGAGTVTACAVNTDGTLQGCTAAADSTFNGTAGLAVR